MTDEVDDFLEHYGVKGMRWGVRNDEKPTGRKRGKGQPPKSSGGGRKFSDEDEASYSDQMRRKYGPPGAGGSGKTRLEDHPSWDGLTEDQKRFALIVGGVALLGVGAYALHKTGFINEAMDAAKWLEYHKERIAELGSVDIADLSPGMETHWDKGVNLPAGAILQRLSTVKETEIRPGGFFAAFDPKDITRYKAELPVWWGRWGLKETEGYLVKLKSNNVGIKAPSGKETFEIFKQVVDRDDLLQRYYHGKILESTEKLGRDKAVDAMAKHMFPNFARNWADGLDHDRDVQKFFGLVRQRGYNALIDFNDSGNLAETPLRVINSSDFSIAGHEFVGQEDILNAVKEVSEFVMSASLVKFLAHHGVKEAFMQTEVNEFLEHYGVKGMRWGVRNDTRRRKKARTRYEKSPKRLSDAELKRRISRMETEKRYNELNKRDISTGEKLVSDILTQVGKQTASTLLAGAALYGGKKALEKKIGKEKVDAMFPKKKK